MSRLGRKDAATSTIAVWRWLNERPDAPNIDGNREQLRAAVPDLPHVPKTSETGLSQRITLMEHLGLLKFTLRQVGTPGASGSRFVGTTTLIEPDVEKGAKAIAQHFARGGYLKLNAKGNKQLLRNGAERPVDPDKVVVQTDERERPVAAVVGPDAPTLGEGLRETFVAMQTQEKDESAALVAAARQYSSRQDFVITKLKEMEALGIQLDRTKVLQGVKLQRDDELEGIVKVLPYIDQLEVRLKQTDGWRQAMLDAKEQAKESAREVERLTGEVRRQQEANRRLVEERVRQPASPTVLVGR